MSSEANGKSNGTSNGNGNGHSRWNLMISLLSAAAVAIGAIVAAYVQTASLTAQVGIDNTRIQALEITMAKASDRLSGLRADLSQTHADLREVETQFCASDIIRNLMHAFDQRIAALLWRRAYPGAALPTDNAYYPHICNRANTAPLEHAND